MFLALTDTLLAILAFVLILGAIVLIHEGGHFFFARRAGILCREYAFGMGPLLWKKKKGETTYSIRLLPIGGFCAICGEENEQDPLKGLTKIRFEMKDGVVTKIYLPTDGKNPVHLFDDKPLYDLVSYDLFDKDDTGELYLEVKKPRDSEASDENVSEVTEKIKVARDAYYVFGVGKHDNENVAKEVRLKKCVEEFQIGPHDRTLNSKKFSKKFMVMFGGPLMNFVLALIAFFISTLITGTSNTKSAIVGEFGIEDTIASVEKNENYISVGSAFTESQTATIYGYVTEINNNQITLSTDLDGKTSKVVTLKEDEKVHLYSYTLIDATYSSGSFINGSIQNESRVTSPLYIAGVREGDCISSLETNGNVTVVSSWNDISDFMDSYVNLEHKEEIKVTYFDKETEELKTVTISPMVYIYSISMVEDISSDEVKIDELSEKSKAYIAGLREGDIILEIEIDSKVYQIDSWLDVMDCFMIPTDGKTDVTLTVSRDGETIEGITVTPYSKKLFDKTQSVAIVEAKMGITCTTTHNIFAVVKSTFVQMGTAIVQLFNTLGMLIFSSSVGIKDLSGPVGIFSMTKSAVSGGIGYLFYWLGFLSVNVGFMNLLPIPALDGGRILFLLIEKIFRKPVSQKAQDIAINVTYYALLALILYVTVNDILRLI